MAKRTLYAHVLMLLVGLTAGSALAQSPAVPCGACVSVGINAGQALLLPPELFDLEVLVRADSGDDAAVAAALEAIAAAGGRAGLLVEPRATAPISRAEQAFEFRTRITELRARFPATTIVVALDPASPLVDDVRPYVDRAVTIAGTVASVSDTLRGANDAVWLLPGDAIVAARVMQHLATAARWLPVGLVADEQTAIVCGGHRLPAFLDPRTQDLFAIAFECPPEARISVAPARGVERIELGPLTLLRALSSTTRPSEDVAVRAPRALTVEEIVARHQAAAARQRRAIATVMSTGTMTLTFEAPGFPAPVTITSEAVIFAGNGLSEIQQRDIRVNGIAFGGSRVPRLPIIEPERAASPPLTITLTDVYRYRLAGQEILAGRPAYIVEFEPIDGRASLFRGRAWFDQATFGMMRVAAAQTGLRGAIVSSEQVDHFRLEGDLWLLDRSEVRQLYEGAAHRTPIQRVLQIVRHEVNAEAFDARRAAAYASPDVMLRDTAEGFRYLRRTEIKAADGTLQVVPELAPRADRVRTLALGVIVDPNISRPLPFAGLSYVDFNLFGTGTQFNGFFGGTYAQAAFSVPSVGGTRWQMAGRAFGIASSYNDRSFVNGREIYEQDIRQRPAHASVWLLRPLSPRVTFRAGYELDYTQFRGAPETADDFLVPADQVAHAARIAVEGQRAGWNASVWWAPARRSGWREWGRPGDYTAEHRDYQRFGLSVARPFVLSPRLVGRVEGAWMDGHDLDRFSRYSFGTFDNRLRGYPSALIRYGKGGVARGSLAWATGRHFRVDAFLDSAYVHDPGFGSRMRNYTGLGAALEAPAPFGTLVAVEWGYGFRGVNSDGSLGTQVIRISGFKIF